ncbi:DNA repair protein RecN [Fusibacter paucivorans]|uniref:DNA repair protein RecN n=1 Tax=Fusibacter paucivorans TaxID=76009 RepID=A0ABS5PNE5_9FIRM|nr:DNA repair protein RecN [Fusibacter paucivorans]MBS7526693.1 DNA repair protein RecN [Fusibacter paucivorans]
MIFELKIKDFILIESETVLFKDGLNIITGETGAGKSMILGAINLVLGAPASNDVIRLGADGAQIQCSFFANERANEVLKTAGIAVDPDLIVISREISRKGRRISRINGETATLNVIKEVTQYLLDIHGQFDNQALFNKAYQLELVDAYGGAALIAKRKQLSEIFEKLHTEIALRDELLNTDENKEKQVDFLNFQCKEIDEVALKVGEDETIEASFAYYTNLERIAEAFESAEAVFEGEFGDGVLSALSKLTAAFHKVEAFDEHVKGFSKRLSEQFYLLEDLSRDLNHFAETLSADPEQYAQLEKRLDDINRLKSKYGKTVEVILDYRQSIAEQLEAYEQLDVRIAAHEKQISVYEKAYDTMADELTAMRMKASKPLKKAVTAELTALNMKAATFDIQIELSHERTASGRDDIAFVIATNAGQPLKPLKRVLSGGELSRLMLAIKMILGISDHDVAQIFDEIDAGISGATANVVGEKLHALASDNQIVCITHLPQIAVFADHHFRIVKASEASGAKTMIEAIEGDAVVEEIGRLVGGVEMTRNTVAHAKEMLTNAVKRKQNH